MTCANLIAAAKKDGATEPDKKGCCPEGSHKIQILKEKGDDTHVEDAHPTDFHVLKGGRCGVPNSSLLDNAGKPMIVDDADADAFKGKYPENCGELCVKDKK